MIYTRQYCGCFASWYEVCGCKLVRVHSAVGGWTWRSTKGHRRWSCVSPTDWGERHERTPRWGTKVVMQRGGVDSGMGEAPWGQPVELHWWESVCEESPLKRWSRLADASVQMKRRRCRISPNVSMRTWNILKVGEYDAGASPPPMNSTFFKP